MNEHAMCIPSKEQELFSINRENVLQTMIKCTSRIIIEMISIEKSKYSTVDGHKITKKILKLNILLYVNFLDYRQYTSE